MIFENDKQEDFYECNSQVKADERRRRITNPTPYSGLGKLPPQAIDLEEAILGGVMSEANAILNILEFMTADMFYETRHQYVFKAILKLFEKSSPIDFLTVIAQLRAQGELEMVGGAYYITQLTDRSTGASSIEYHARIVQQKFIQREMIRLSTEVIQQAYDDTTDVLNLLDDAQLQFSKLSDNKSGKKTARIDSLIEQRQADYKVKPLTGLTGVPSGLRDLDEKTNGWQNGNLIIVGARPAMGKTAFVLNCARNAAVDHGKKVLIFSLEMSDVQLTDRLISRECEIRQDTLLKRKLQDHEHDEIENKVSALRDSKLFIDDTPGINLMGMRAKTFKIKQQYGLDLIIIDYLQLMEGAKNGRENREQVISSISRGLKKLARELGIPVIALSQLSRDSEKRPGKDSKPILSDLRESGAIEQDADDVLFLYRPEYYGIRELFGQSTVGLCQVIIAKYRQGVVDTVNTDFHGSYMRFGNWGEDTQQPTVQLIKTPELGFATPTDNDDDDLPF